MDTEATTAPAGQPDDEEYLTQEEAAPIVRLSERTLQRYRSEGGGPPWVRRGPRRVFYPRSKLLAWVKEATLNGGNAA